MTAAEAFQELIDTVSAWPTQWETNGSCGAPTPRQEQEMLLSHIRMLKLQAERAPDKRTPSIMRSSWGTLMRFRDRPDVLSVLQKHRAVLGEFIRGAANKTP